MHFSFLCNFLQFFFFISSLLFLPISSAFAIESVADRKQVATEKSRKFSKSPIARSSISLSGSYTSDQDSKEYQLQSRYFYQSDKQMHQIDFLHEVRYANAGSTPSKLYLVKKSDLYDAEISSKFILGQSKNYAALYSRSTYDELSKYYFDLRNAVGLGRMFFGDKLEFDTSIGYHDVKAYGNEVFFVPSIRLNMKLSEKTTLIHRGYMFLDHEGFDNEFKTSLRYRLNEKLSFEVNHTYDQRRYEDDAAHRQINLISKYIAVGFIYDLD